MRLMGSCTLNPWGLFARDWAGKIGRLEARRLTVSRASADIASDTWLG